MFCSSCGTQLSDDAQFCSNCGARVGVANTNPTVNPVTYTNPTVAGNGTLDIKWAHFLSYGYLWLAAFMNLIWGIVYLTGKFDFNDIPREVMYYEYDALAYADKLYAVAIFIVLTMQLISAIYILNLKRDAGTILFAAYVFKGIAALLMIAGVIIITGDLEMIILNIFTLFGAVIMAVVNKIYFDNRKEIYVR